MSGKRADACNWKPRPQGPVPSPQSEGQVCVLRSEDTDVVRARLCKSGPVYTPDIELLLANLGESLQVVHTVDPRKAERSAERWMPSIHKEIGVVERDVQRMMRFVLAAG